MPLTLLLLETNLVDGDLNDIVRVLWAVMTDGWAGDRPTQASHDV